MLIIIVGQLGTLYVCEKPAPPITALLRAPEAGEKKEKTRAQG